jgi:hypothetical protein
MRFKTMIVLVLVALIALPALANEKPAQKMTIERFLANNPFHGPAMGARDYFEGFEGGVLPATWGQTIVNPDRTWGVTNSASTGSLEGSYVAFIGYDLTIFQNETISFDQYVDVAGGEYVLSFYMAGSLGNSWDLNVAETVEVNGVTVFDFDSSVTAGFTFEQYFIDLSAYDGQTVTITFRYEGVDGDLHVLDAVMVDDGTGYVYIPPEPPANDTCESAFDGEFEILPGAFSFDTDNTLANADYALAFPSCTGYGVSGQDVVYYVCLNQGEVLDVSMQCGFDASLFIVTDCADPQNSCVAGADATVSEGLEEIIGFTAPADGMYYVIVSAYSSGTGPINVYGTNYGGGCVIATEETSFGGIKSIYR